jgi:hypothetical protein
MDAWLIIGMVLIAIFAVDAAQRWWRHNAWRYHRHDDDDDPPVIARSACMSRPLERPIQCASALDAGQHTCESPSASRRAREAGRGCGCCRATRGGDDRGGTAIALPCGDALRAE